MYIICVYIYDRKQSFSQDNSDPWFPQVLPMAASAVPKCIFMHQSQELSSCSLLPVSSQNRTEMEPHCWPILAQLFPYLILLHSSCFDIQDN